MHRALRLIMTAGAVAAGLCLVVGMVTLVVALGDHGKAGQNRTGVAGRTRPGTRPPGSQRTQPPHGGAGPGSRARGADRGPRLSSRPFSRGKQLAFYHGSGSAEPGPLHVPAPGAWGLYWQYRCPGGRPGEFILGETRTSASLALAGYCLKLRMAPPRLPAGQSQLARAACDQSKIGFLVRLRFSSKKPSVPATSSRPSHNLAASSPRGIGDTTGPKIDMPSTEMIGVPTS